MIRRFGRNDAGKSSVDNSSKRRQARRSRLQLERLEKREVMTVLFAPQAGPELAHYGGGAVLNDTPVYLVFWGTDWDKPGGPTTSRVINALDSLALSPALQGLGEYSTNTGVTNAHYAGMAYVGLPLVPNFSYADMEKVVDAATVAQIPDPDDTDPPSLVFVVTPAGFTAQGGGVSSHGSFKLPTETEYVGWIQDTTNADQLDSRMSHELLESITDPAGDDSGVFADPGLLWTHQGDSNEIGDAEAQTYFARVNHHVVQSIWSQQFGKYEVEDGNPFQFQVAPSVTKNLDGSLNWVGGTLTLNGDAKAGASFTIDIGPGGGIRATVNDQVPQVVEFDPGQITNIQVNMGGSILPSQLFIPNSNISVPINIAPGGSTGSVTIGSGGKTTLIGSPITIAANNLGGNIDLVIDDSADAIGRVVNVSSSSVTGMTGSPVKFDQNALHSLEVLAGNGNDTVTVLSTPTNALYSNTVVNSGGGASNKVVVQKTSSPLDFEAGLGSAAVSLGYTNPVTNTTNVQLMTGPVYVGASTGSVDLVINDGGNQSHVAATMNGGINVGITGLAPAPISWRPTSTSSGGVTHVTIQGGSGGNQFTILDTPMTFTAIDLNTGLGGDTTFVNSTTGRININGQSGSDTIQIGNHDMSKIAANIYLTNGLGSNTVTLWDDLNVAPRSVTLGANSVTGMSPGIITYTLPNGALGGTSYLTLNGGKGGNIYNVNAVNVPTTLNAGAGNDKVYVFATAKPLVLDGHGGQDTDYLGLASNQLPNSATTANLLGGISLANTGGTTSLLVSDVSHGVLETSIVSTGEIDGIAPVALLYNSAQVTNIEVDGGKAGNIFNVTSLWTGVSLKLVGSSGTDIFNVGNNTDGLNQLQGSVNVIGNAGADTLNVLDAASTLVRDYGLGGSLFTTSHLGNIAYSMIESMALNMSKGADSIALPAPLTTVPTTINGGGGSDTIIGPISANNWSISGANTGTLGAVSFNKVQNVQGNAGRDTFTMQPAGSLSGTLSGGGQAAGTLDWVDYSSRSTPVSVNLSTGTATGLGGISGVNGLLGGNGGNVLAGGATPCVLVGGLGADQLFAASGRAVIIGGAGSDTLTGGADYTLMIAGRTAYDANTAALDAIISTWSQTAGQLKVKDLSSALKSGIANGLYKLDGTTVFDDNAIDTLNTGVGDDWFLFGPNDKVTKKGTDTLN